MDFKLFWSEEAIRNLENILDYLIERWSQREVDNFKNRLSRLLDLIVKNPRIFPVSEYNPRLRKAVLSKQTTVFYEIKENVIYIAYLFVNHQNINKIK
ncbi:MAG: type II toxin-antitoxin system RelE/ParE family toxin [Mariniphaga sp.]|nr:type II toxin-antitoxin system RelE/ParE family toxin [Mariniphaga sp.]